MYRHFMTTPVRRPKVRGYRDLIAWQKAIALVVSSYSVARCLPPEERYELGKQLRRSSISIPANIAEGAGRRHRADYARFLTFSRGSLSELETYLEIIRLLEFAPLERTEPAIELASEVGRMLTVMLRRHARPIS